MSTQRFASPGESTRPRDDHEFKLNALFFKRVFKLTRPYWVRRSAGLSWLAVATLAGLGIAYAAMGGYWSFLLRNQADALVAKNAAAYWPMLVFSTLFLAFRVGSMQLSLCVAAWLQMDWRRWLTIHLLDKYLERRTYYEIVGDPKIDNPDQRIQAEVGPFVEFVAFFPRQMLTAVMDISVQGLILLSISTLLFWLVVAFAVFQIVAMVRVYKPTIRQNFDVTLAEADLRHGISHVRNNAETVAFYRGEAAERGRILVRLSRAVRKTLKADLYSYFVSWFDSLIAQAWNLVPVLVLVPLFFRGEIQYGAIAQGTAAAMMLLESMGFVTKFLPNLTAAAPRTIRLAQIAEKFEVLGRELVATAQAPRLQFSNGPTVSLTDVSVQTPGGEQQLVRNLSLTIANGQHLIVVGRTGVGKSSLLRVMAGLWTRGSGGIMMPPPEQLLFLPQRPYMIQADLRSQLLYPSERTDLSDAELQAMLERVSLPDLADQHGGFDAVKDWERVLSLGEQQRIAFARVLVARPRYVFLDEATSAVDMETERLLYGLLARSGATFISVGHRPSLFGYHVSALRLTVDGAWELAPASHMENTTIHPHAAAL